MDNRCEVCLNISMEDGGKVDDVNMVDDVYGSICVLVWLEGGDEVIGVCNVWVVLWKDRR